MYFFTQIKKAFINGFFITLDWEWFNPENIKLEENHNKLRKQEIEEIRKLSRYSIQELRQEVDSLYNSPESKFKNFIRTEYKWANENYLMEGWKNVKDLQNALNEYFKKKPWDEWYLVPDNDFWKDTLMAVLEFQKAHADLDNDWLAWPKTQEKLFWNSQKFLISRVSEESRKIWGEESDFQFVSPYLDYGMKNASLEKESDASEYDLGTLYDWDWYLKDLDLKREDFGEIPREDYFKDPSKYSWIYKKFVKFERSDIDNIPYLSLWNAKRLSITPLVYERLIEIAKIIHDEKILDNGKGSIRVTSLYRPPKINNLTPWSVEMSAHTFYLWVDFSGQTYKDEKWVRKNLSGKQKKLLAGVFTSLSSEWKLYYRIEWKKRSRVKPHFHLAITDRDARLAYDQKKHPDKYFVAGYDKRTFI